MKTEPKVTFIVKQTRADKVNEDLRNLRAAVEACTFDQYGSLYSVREARRVVVAARALLGLPPMPEN